MTEQAAGCRIKVEALDEAYQALAEQWAERLGLPLDEPDAEFALQLSAQGCSCSSWARMRPARCGSILSKAVRPIAVCLAAVRGR